MAEAGYQIFTRNALEPSRFPDTYGVVYTGWLSFMSAVNDLFHRSNAEFEVGQTVSIQREGKEKIDPSKESMVFGWAYDEETGELIEINDAFDDDEVGRDLEEEVIYGKIPMNVVNSLYTHGILSPSAPLRTIVKRERWVTFSKRIWSKAKRFGLKIIGGIAKYGLLAILVIVIFALVVAGAIYIILKLLGFGTNVETTPSPFDPSDPRFPTCQYAKMPDGSVWHTKNNKGDIEQVGKPPVETLAGAITIGAIGLGIGAVLIAIAYSKVKKAKREGQK
jgi:hypothetical protein